MRSISTRNAPAPRSGKRGGCSRASTDHDAALALDRGLDKQWRMEAPDHVEIVDCHRRNCEPDLLGKPRSSNLIKPTSLTQNALPRAIGIPPRRINEIFPGKRSVTAGTGLR